MDGNRLPKEIMEWILRKMKERKTKNIGDGVREAINERNLVEEQWNNRREWQLRNGQWRRTF
jgi:hypothetical protein